MRTIQLTPVEYQALMAFADGVHPSRPVRRRLLQVGALVYARYGDSEPVLKLSDSAMASLVENAPRSKWSASVAMAKMKQAGDTVQQQRLPSRSLTALAIAAAVIGGGR